MRTNENPLAQYGITSISVPMFLNQTTIPDVTGPFTKEIRLMLQRYPGLKVHAGDCSEVDACLIGILSSSKILTETVESTQFDRSSKMARSATIPRADFFLPIASEIKLKLKLILLKAPTHSEISIFQSTLGEEIQIHPKMVFNKTIPVSLGFNREVFDRDATSDGGVVNMVQNVGAQSRTVKQMANTAALLFKDLVLDAF